MRFIIPCFCLLFTTALFAQNQVSTSSAMGGGLEASVATDTNTDNWLAGLPVFPKAIYLPAALDFGAPFTGKVQIITEEGREVLHAELTAKENLPLPPGGLNGTYVLRLIDLDSGKLLYSEKVIFK